jgi:hypothetical protein
VTRSVRLLAAAIILLGGCGGGEPAGAPGTTAGGTTTSGTAGTRTTASTPGPSGAVEPVPKRLTPEDDGGRFTMPAGTTTTLRVADPAVPDPTVVGESVLVVPMLNVTDSGVREWELRGVAPGTTTITGRDPDYTLTITVS